MEINCRYKEYADNLYAQTYFTLDFALIQVIESGMELLSTTHELYHINPEKLPVEMVENLNNDMRRLIGSLIKELKKVLRLIDYTDSRINKYQEETENHQS